MAPNNLILALDQGTTQNKAYVFDARLRILAERARELPQYFPRPGWVEHDLDQIHAGALAAAKDAIRRARVSPARIAAIVSLWFVMPSAEAAVILHFDGDGADLVTHCGGVDSAIARLLSIVHGSMNDRTWARLKACPAEDCQWAFYDHSRNRSGTWCEIGKCGNRAKARRFRERNRPA